MEVVFNKLVRDNIPDMIINNGEEPVTRVLNDEEYKEELRKKYLEEVAEVISAKEKEDTLEELADVLEITRALANLEGSNLETVIDIANKKCQKRGGFEKRIYLEKKIVKE